MAWHCTLGAPAAIHVERLFGYKFTSPSSVITVKQQFVLYYMLTAMKRHARRHLVPVQDVPVFGISDFAEHTSATVFAFKLTHQSQSSVV